MGEAKRRGTREQRIAEASSGKNSRDNLKPSQSERLKTRIEKLPEDLVVNVYGSLVEGDIVGANSYFKIGLDKEGIMRLLQHSIEATGTRDRRIELNLPYRLSYQTEDPLSFEMVSAVDHLQASIIVHGRDLEFDEEVSQSATLGSLLRSIERQAFDPERPMRIWFGCMDDLEHELMDVFDAMCAFGDEGEFPLNEEALSELNEAEKKRQSAGLCIPYR